MFSVSRYIDKEYYLEGKRCDARNRRKNGIRIIYRRQKNSSCVARKFRKITVFRIEVTNQIKFRILDLVEISLSQSQNTHLNSSTIHFYNRFHETNAYLYTTTRQNAINRYVENIFFKTSFLQYTFPYIFLYNFNGFLPILKRERKEE